MSTLKQVFYEAIKKGDWEDIRRVYTTMTGLTAPHPPKQSSLDILDVDMDDDKPPLPTGGVILEPRDTMPVLIAPESTLPRELVNTIDVTLEKLKQINNTGNAPSGEAADITSEFYIQQGTPERDVDDEGKTKCKREAMVIPTHRENLFHDDGTEFAQEKVTENPALGVQKPRSRENPSRKPTQKITVTCSACNKQETISPQLATRYSSVPERNTYKCNACCIPGSRKR